MLCSFKYQNLSKIDELKYEKLVEHKEQQLCDPIIKARPQQFYVDFDGVKYPQLIPSYHNRSKNFSCLNSYPKTKVILLWNRLTMEKSRLNYGYASGNLIGRRTPYIKGECPLYNCELTSDKKRVHESDLILFNTRNKDFMNRLPLKRPKHSRLVMYQGESTLHSYDLSHLERVFNLTATHKTNSDFYPYYHSTSGMKWKLNADFNENRNFQLIKQN
jgi:hypothetical protein